MNITQFLTNNFPNLTRSEEIVIAHDIQAESYTKQALDNPEFLKNHAREIHELSKSIFVEGDVILDCGAGELRTLSALSEQLPHRCQLIACDLSLSRMRVGRRFADRFMRDDLSQNLRLFVANMSRLPLSDGSVDVVFTSHSLEPNHGGEQELIKELLRVSRTQLLLFEPSWENADEAARARM